MLAGQFVKEKNEEPKKTKTKNIVHLRDSRHKLKTDCCDVITSKLLKQSQPGAKLYSSSAYLCTYRGIERHVSQFFCRI